jgi:HK97 family phage portal protein
MGLINKLFAKQINSAIEKKAQDLIYQGEQDYFRSIYGNMLGAGFQLKPDGNVGNYVTQGFEQNPDVYSILMRCSTQAGQVEWEVSKGKDEIEEDVTHPLNRFIKSPNSYQTFTEMVQVWQIFHLLTGNGLIYYPTIKFGNNRGKLMDIGAFNLPTQDISIESGGFLKPILNYIVDTNILPENKLPLEDVIHTRLPNLDYSMGNNLMGMSPVKVAANIIKLQNSGIGRIQELYNTGIPPGIINRIFTDENLNASNVTNDARQAFEKNWKKKTQQGLPLFGFGRHEYIKLGTDIVRDLDLISTYPLGFRILCNLWGLPSQLFNDVAGTTFNNMEQAVKSMWTNRLIPDLYMLAEKINQKIQVIYPGYEIWPSFDKIPELQPDKQKIAQMYGELYAKGLYRVNEVREKLDDEKIDGEFGESFYGVMGNKVDPMADVFDQEVAKAEQALNEQNVNDYKK